MKYYTVYDMKNNEQCVGVFYGIKEVAKYFNIKPQSISTSMFKNSKIKGRYSIEPLILDE